MKPFTLRRTLRNTWRARWRMTAIVTMPIYTLSLLPPNAWALETGDGHPQVVLTNMGVHVNKQAPKITRYAGVNLSVQPTDHELTYSHAFAEPLLPLGAKTTPAENKALATAIKTFAKRTPVEDVSALTSFLVQYPNSAWRPTIDLNLAKVYFDNGYFSSALDSWTDAWTLTKDLSDPDGIKIGNLAAAYVAKMEARIGRTQELVDLFKQVKGRNMTGQAAQLMVQAQSGLWLMQNRPQDAFRCGPSALQEIYLATHHKLDHPEIIKQSRSTPQGVALTDVQALATKLAMPMQMAKRTEGSAFVIPAVIHWKLGHYAALVGQRDGKYIVQDTTFGSAEFLVNAQALEQEASGYFLIPTGKLMSGWTKVSLSDGENVFGRGNTQGCDPGSFGAGGPANPPGGSPGNDCKPSPNNGNPDGPNPEGNNTGDGGGFTLTGDSGAGSYGTGYIDFPPMTDVHVSSMLISLNLIDTPVLYSPPIGPTMHFTVQYNQRDNSQPATFAYSNLGPGWTYSYLAYVLPGSGTSTVYERGGGIETFYYNSGASVYYPSQKTQAVLLQVNSTTWQRTLAGGEIETYGQPDGSGKFFLTKITDKLRNSLTLIYDANFRISSMTDALGQVTNLTYGNASDIYKITKVTDPFGRFAQFDYDAYGNLQKITDIIGITSQFTYLTNGFVSTLTTPYGKTSFAYGDSSTDSSLGTARWLEVAYPDGQKDRTEYRQGATGISNSDPVGGPVGMSMTNDYLQYRDTYYWDKQAMKTYSGDYTKAMVTHWLHTSDINTTSDIVESEKKIDQNRIWYSYSGEISSYQASSTMINEPSLKGRILDDGTTQLFRYQYNSIGKVTQEIDPVGRETDYVYDTNNIDLLTVKQKNGTVYDVVSSYTYNSQHEMLTATDEAGQVTSYVYYPNGQVHTVTNAKGQAITYAYSGSYLTSVTGPVAGATTSMTYDGYGRVRTVTNSQGYVVTTDYDVMDRPTKITYPDSTFDQINYLYLDPQFTKDRLGRWRHSFYNSIRQKLSEMDSLGHVTTWNWNLAGQLSSMIDASGNCTNWKYDNQNRPVEKDYADSHHQTITYENSTSRVKSTTDAAGQTTTFTYNQDNTVSQKVYTSATVATPTVSYTYDSIYPRVSTMVDGTGTTTYTYNPITTTPTLGAGAVGSVTTPLTTISFTYDELGRQLSHSINGISSSVTYDTLGRFATATNALSSTAFTYSYLGDTGRVSQVTNPNGQKTINTYQDSSGTGEPRLSEIKNLTSSGTVISQFDYGYDVSGQITSWTQTTDSNHPQNYALQYDNGGRLTGATLTDTVTSAILHQYGYGYDSAGNRTTEQVDGAVTTSNYNNLNQLTGTNAGGKMIFSGTISKYSTVTVGGTAASLDASDNFLGTASVSTGTNSVPIVARDVDGNTSTNNYQVVVPTSAAGVYTYDLNGNLTGDGSRTFGWDAKNELVSIIYLTGANAGNHTEFTYNGAGQRVAIVERSGTTIGSGTIASTKQFVWSGLAIAEERDATNAVTKRFFAQGEQRIIAGVTTNYFYTRDHLGSIREMIDSSGVIQSRYNYDPFGRASQISGSLSCDFQYAGMYMHINSSLNLTKFRAYNSGTGIWISRDPLGEQAGRNLYIYCNNNPINNVDPSGLVSLSGLARAAYVVGWLIWNSIFWSGGTGPTPPPSVPTPPGTSSPATPRKEAPAKPDPQSKQGGCPDAPPAPAPTPGPPPLPPLLPAKTLTPAEEEANQAANAAARQDFAESTRAAAAYAEEADALTVVLEVDEAVVAVGVILK